MSVQAIPSETRSTLATPMEQPTLMPSKCFVRDLANGQEVNSIFVVRSHSQRQRRNGETFLKLQLGDVTGCVEAVVWDEVNELAPLCPSGSVIRVLGRYTVFLPWVEEPQSFDALSAALAEFSDLPTPRPRYVGKQIAWPVKPLYALDRVS